MNISQRQPEVVQPGLVTGLLTIYSVCRNVGRVAVLGCLLSAAVQADTPPVAVTVEPGIQALLDKTLDEREAAQVLGVQKANLDHQAPGQETVLLWVKLGPTYWSSQLSVLSQRQGQWTLLATTSLDGSEAQSVQVGTDGLIRVEAKTPGPNDPICCPSQVSTLRYQYSAGHLKAALSH